MIEILQLQKDIEPEFNDAKIGILFQELENISMDELEGIYVETGELETFDDAMWNKNKILELFHKSNGKKNIPLTTTGLFGFGDMVNIDGSYFVYYDPWHWELINIIGNEHSTKSDWKEEEINRTTDGRFATKDTSLIKHPDGLPDSMKNRLLYRFTPHSDAEGKRFNLDWIEDRISGKKKLEITEKNFQIGVEQFANVLTALFTLNEEYQSGEYSDVILQFLEKKLKDYRKFGDDLGKELMKIGEILAPDPDKSTKSQNENFDTINKCIGLLKDFDLVFKSMNASKSVKKVKSNLKQWQDKI